MPFALNNFTGGLGNQLFSILTVYSLSKKYNTPFIINQTDLEIKGYNSEFVIPVYLKTVFEEIIKESSTEFNTLEYISSIVISISQFHDFHLPPNVNPDTTLIYITGLPMKYSLFSNYLDEIKDMMYRQKIKYIPGITKDHTIRRIGIMFRTYVQEKNNSWMTTEEYYTKAIGYILEQHKDKYTLEFHVYTDEAGVTEYIIKPIINKLNLTVNTKEYVGVRDNKTDVEHLFAMFDLDDYILCNSTYHYWPALLSRYTNDKIVTFPSYTKDGKDMLWFNHIVPSEWIKL